MACRGLWTASSSASPLSCSAKAHPERSLRRAPGGGGSASDRWRLPWWSAMKELELLEEDVEGRPPGKRVHDAVALLMPATGEMPKVYSQMTQDDSIKSLCTVKTA